MRLFFKDFAQWDIGKWTEKSNFLYIKRSTVGHWATYYTGIVKINIAYLLCRKYMMCKRHAWGATQYQWRQPKKALEKKEAISSYIIFSPPFLFMLWSGTFFCDNQCRTQHFCLRFFRLWDKPKGPSGLCGKRSKGVGGVQNIRQKNLQKVK